LFDLDFWTLSECKKVIITNKILFISPLELVIPYKLFLGSEKDIEDAMYLFNVFEDYLDMNMFSEFNRKLNTKKLFNTYIK
jgi:hypothetical protein